jgi:hypothetical protein
MYYGSLVEETSSALKMEVADSSKTWVPIYQTTGHHIPEAWILNIYFYLGHIHMLFHDDWL